MIDDKYSAAGVDYDALDRGKRIAQVAAAKTVAGIERAGFREIAASRGESAYVVDVGPMYVAQVTEALGSKNLVADAVRSRGGATHYDAIARDTVATIVNDLATVGATPVSLTSYWAVRDAAWFADEARLSDLTEGWAAACRECGIVWGGGETQVLKDIVEPGAIVLGGSAVGVLSKDRFLHGGRIEAGDVILVAPSTGVHANGLTLARAIAQRLPLGYATPVSGSTYGEALLVPTPQYIPLVQAILNAGVPLHYAAQITGHGWRKFMRADRDFVYAFDRVPLVPPVLRFLSDQAGMSEAEAYGTFNMGAGLGLYVPERAVDGAIAAARDAGFQLEAFGRVTPGKRSVRIAPLGIEFDGSSLRLRATADAT